MLRDAGLNDIRISHVGSPANEDWIMTTAKECLLTAKIVRSNPNIFHFETLAMLEVEQLAKSLPDDALIIYLHTKGVSQPFDTNKQLYRKAMGYHVITKWRENIEYLTHGCYEGHCYDVVGFNYEPSVHIFNGNFWITRAGYARHLPDFNTYHQEQFKLSRYSCEHWVTSIPHKPYSVGVTNVPLWLPGFDNFTPLLPPKKQFTITWVSAISGRQYIPDLTRLASSTKLLSHDENAFIFKVMNEPWKHTCKGKIIRELLPTITTSHVFWIDADCEFVTCVQPEDIIDPLKPLSAVRHFSFNSPQEHLPDIFRARLPAHCDNLYWQACLFGGTKAALKEVLDNMTWMDAAGQSYDEHGLVVELCRRAKEVNTLPCRYAAPSSFLSLVSYKERAGGEVAIIHYNRTSSEYENTTHIAYPYKPIAPRRLDLSTLP